MRGAWGRLSLRARLLVIGLAGVATALALGSVVLYAVLTVAGYHSLDASGAATAHEVAGLVDQQQLPDPIPVTGSQVVQVVDGQGRVVSASANADRLTALLLPRERRAARAGQPVEVSGARVGLDSPLRVVAVPAGPARAQTVLVGQQFDDLTHSQRVLRATLLVTYPLLLAVLGLIAWRVVGATLRPVEALRSSAERISGRQQDTRLPVPSSGDEIHRLAVTLNSMLDRLAGSRARQRSFVADAAHELRSPLASMQTQIEVQQRVDGPTWQLQELAAEVHRMARLVDDLLLLARLDAETLPVGAPDEVAVADLVDEIAGRPGGAVAVTPHVAAGPPLVVRGRRDDLRRVLGNLVDNATRHARTTVEVAAYPEGDRVVVEVTDDGAGIAEAERDRVFERFTRLDEGRARDAGGSGLGLAIVRELVERDGGTVRLDTSPSGGLSARLLLRRAGTVPAPG